VALRTVTFGGATPEGHREIDVTVRVRIPFTWAVVAADLRSQIASLSGKDAERRFYALWRRQPDFSEVSFAGLDFPDRVPVLPYIRDRLGDGRRKIVLRFYPIAPRASVSQSCVGRMRSALRAMSASARRIASRS
jgi:hypothetical protein